jgi:hypothetical protein
MINVLPQDNEVMVVYQGHGTCQPLSEQAIPLIDSSTDGLPVSVVAKRVHKSDDERNECTV